MIIHAKTAGDLQNVIQTWKANTQRIGFVPTMGALHAGHLSLIEIAAQNAQKVVVSIFVNPTQFAPNEDFDSYPRTLEDDMEKLECLRQVDAVYAPRVIDLYPNGAQPHLRAGLEAQGLESDFRPHFFDGVVSVVHRLFQQTQADCAVFGQKDFQQYKVIEEMTRDQNMPIEIIGGKIIRDAHGLALSSRNAYLSPQDISIAQNLNKILRKNITAEQASAEILAAGFDKIDYVSERWGRRLAAAWLGKTRLIDNVAVS